jgi:hypothetical protein
MERPFNGGISVAPLLCTYQVTLRVFETISPPDLSS